MDSWEFRRQHALKAPYNIDIGQTAETMNRPAWKRYLLASKKDPDAYKWEGDPLYEEAA